MRSEGEKLSIIFVIVSIIFLSHGLIDNTYAANGAITWAKSYSGTGVEEGTSIQQTSDGGYVVAVAGNTAYGAGGSDALVLKLDSDGNIQWQKTYGGTGYDQANSIQQTSDGGYILAGVTSSFSDYEWDGGAWILKLDSSGNIQWQKTYTGSWSVWQLAGPSVNLVRQVSDGGYIVAGGVCYSAAWCYGDLWVSKLHSGGDIQWQRVYAISDDSANSIISDDWAYSIQQTSDGGYIVAGSTGVVGENTSDLLILKLDPNGNIQWQKTYGGSNTNGAKSIQQTSDGGYIVAGYTASGAYGGSDAWVLKLDSDGNIQWQKTYGGTSDDQANSIQQTPDGGYIVGGFTSSYWNQYDPYNKAWVLKLDSNGNIEWQKTYGGCNFQGRANSIQQTSDGGYAVAGTTDFGGGPGDVWVLKLDSNGNINGCPIVGTSNAQVNNTSATVQDTTAEISELNINPDRISNATVTDTNLTPVITCPVLPTIGYDPSGFGFTATQGGSDPPSQILNISNSCAGTLNWSAGDNATWLNLDRSSGTDSGTVTLSVDISGLAANTYNATITITSPAASNSPVSVPVILTVSPAPDTTPPTPNPMSWETPPNQAGTTSISMVATAAADPSAPISYYFDFVDSPTGGTGGLDSDWQLGTSYTNSALQPNHQYGYRVKAKDGGNNESDYSTPTSYVYTAIETPTGIAFGTVTSTSIQVQSTNTPSALNLGSSGLLIENTTRGTNSSWRQNNDYWISDLLSPNTSYSFRAKARNGDAIETEYYVPVSKYTLANVPVAGFLFGITQNCIRANWIANGNPVGTEYYSENITAGTNSGWITGTSWDSCGLSCGASYSFRVKARNAEGAETDWVSLGSQSTLSCDAVVTWAKTYGNLGTSSATPIQQTTDGGYIVATATGSFGAGGNDAWILKLDSSGNILWQKSYGGIYADLAHSIQQTFDGGYIMAGESDSFFGDSWVNAAWILKLDSGGNIVWEKTYTSGVGGGAHSIQQTSDGGYIVAGRVCYSFDWCYSDAWILKLDSSGNIEWQKTFGLGDEQADSIQQTSEGGYIVIGSTRAINDQTLSTVWIMKLDSSGNIQWQKTYGDRSGEGSHSIKQTSDGGYIVGGYTGSFGAGGMDAWLSKLDSDGNIQWQKTYGGSYIDVANSIEQTSDGGYIVAGSTSSYSDIPGYHSAAWLLKLDSVGNITWEKTYGSGFSDSAYSIQKTSDGGYVTAGTKDVNGSTNLWVLKLDNIGNVSNCSIGGVSTAEVNVTSAVAQDTSAVTGAVDPIYSSPVTSAIVSDSNVTPGMICPALQTIGYDPSGFSFTATQGGGNPENQTLNIWNAGSDVLNWSVSDDATWLSLNPEGGSDNGTVTVSVNISGLGANTYNATITITALAATDSPVSIPVILTISSPADSTPPTGEVTVNNGDPYTTSNTVTLNLSAADPGSGVSQMRFSNDGTTWSDWEPYGTSKTWNLAPGTGSKTVYVQFKDNAGNISTSYTDLIVLDTDPPIGSIVINGGAAYTTNLNVTLTLSATDTGSGVSQMRFSNDEISWSAWESYATSRPWTLTSGNGIKSVYVQYQDGAGNPSGSFSNTILLTKLVIDFDGDNKSDIAVWRPGDGVWYIISSKDGSIIYQQWGGVAFNDVPVPGDYDGDGKTDIAVWRPGDGVWYIIGSKDGSIIYQQWGGGAFNDVPVPGDYDGDGKTDIAVWRPGDGVWYIISSKDGSITAQQWGALGDVPVPGDYDGDGKTDIAVWRPGDGVWYIISSKDGSIIYQQWGSDSLNDEPISQ